MALTFPGFEMLGSVTAKYSSELVSSQNFERDGAELDERKQNGYSVSQRVGNV